MPDTPLFRAADGHSNRFISSLTDGCGLARAAGRPRPPQTESASLYLEDLKKLTLETYIKFITGEKNLSEWDSFVEQFNKNGGAKIIEEINAGLK